MFKNIKAKSDIEISYKDIHLLKIHFSVFSGNYSIMNMVIDGALIPAIKSEAEARGFNPTKSELEKLRSELLEIAKNYEK